MSAAPLRAPAWEAPESEWWLDHFDALYEATWEQLRPDASVAADVEAMHRLLIELGIDGGRLLDAPCGSGRHAIGLARLGYEVDGVDISSDLVRIAHGRLASHPDREVAARVRIDRCDLRTMARVGIYAAAFNWFTSLGYTLREEDDVSLLASTAHALRRGGVLLVETDHYSNITSSFVPSYDVTLEDGTRLAGERTLDRHGVFREQQVIERSGASDSRELRFRVYGIDDLVRLVETAGMSVEEVRESGTLGPFREDARVVLVARRTA